MKYILKRKKEKLIREIEEEGLKKLKKMKLLKLIKDEIQILSIYWTLGQILEIINEDFDLKISKAIFYDFCKHNLLNENKNEDQKSDKGVAQNRITEKYEKSISNIDDLNDLTLDFLSKNLPKK